MAVESPNVVPIAGDPPRSGPLSRPVVLSDLTDDLLWTKLLRVPLLALRTDSLIIAFLALLLCGQIGSLTKLWNPPEIPGFGRAAAEALSLNIEAAPPAGPLTASDPAAAPGAFIARFVQAWVSNVATLASNRPVATILLGIPMLMVVMIAGLAISRQAAAEFAQGVNISWPASLAYSVPRLRQAAFAVFAPLTLALVLGLVVATGGWLLLQWPVIKLLGAALYGFALLAGFVIVAIVGLFVIGGAMLLPAIACDGADGIEAIQRAYAYVPGRPLRMLFYVVVLLILWALVGSLAWAIADITRALTFWLSHLFIATSPAVDPQAFDQRMLRIWLALPTVLVYAFGMSFFFSGATVVYLLLRKLNDGQDISELWMPTMIPGTQAPNKDVTIKSA